MKHVEDAYAKGTQAALGSFGVRIAADLMERRMPDGPAHLGAEWLSRTLSRQQEDHTHVGSKPSYRKLEKPAIWGPRTSLEASGTNFNGMGYGGV